jgi:hypothetical protein
MLKGEERVSGECKMFTSENNFQKLHVLIESCTECQQTGIPFLFVSVVINDESEREMTNMKMFTSNSLFQNLLISPIVFIL